MKTNESILLTLVFAACTSLNSTALAKVVPDASADKGTGRAAWMDDAKYGLFIHWGISSQLADGEWVMRNKRIPVAEYAKLAESFNPVKFNAEEWVAIAKNAGMKYITITSKHHDGFAMYDSNVSDYNIVDGTPFKRDVLMELKKACDKQGIKLGFYYSHAQDWYHPGGSRKEWDPLQKGDFGDYMHKVSIPQIKELLTNYQPTHLWFDTPHGMTPEIGREIDGVVRKIKPDTLTNSRLMYHGKQIEGLEPSQLDGLKDIGVDFLSYRDRTIPPSSPWEYWETCMTINDSWGFKAGDNNWKTPRQVVMQLVEVVSKGGAFLLNVGPTAEGEIPAPAVKTLMAAGDWLKVNGESIYGARPTIFEGFGDDVKVSAKEQEKIEKEAIATGAGKANKGHSEKDYAWLATGRDGKLYLHFFKWPEGPFTLNGFDEDKVTGAYFLADPGKSPVKFAQDGGTVTLTLPAKPLDAINTVLCLNFNQEGSKVLGEQVADVIQSALGEAQEQEASHPPAHSLFYKAQHPETGNMWDVWLYHHEGTYYLYYLANAGPKPPKGQPWNNISLATSPDGVHWTEKGPILKKAEEATWMGTGSTWKSPAFDQDGKFYMNFSEEIGGRQTIYFAESKDLLHWTRLEGEEYRFVPDERWYEKNGRWDCIWTLPKPGGGFYGYWTASPFSKDSKFGFGESDDGLHWKALPPPEVSGVNREHAEVGAVEKIGDKYYMLLGNYPPYMVTLVADRPEGPFRAAQKNFNILTGHTYFCRFFPHPTDGMLVCHFIRDRNGEVSFAPLKDARIDGEGTLRLGWWKGNEKMKRAAIAVETPADTSEAIAMLDRTFDTGKGIILEGTLRLPKGEEEQRSGLYIECGDRGGAGVLIDHSGVAELGSIQANGEDFQIRELNKRGKKRDPKRVDREMTFANPARFRLLLKGPLMEFYLDDILIESFALPANATGRIGLINSAETLGTLKAWE